ncbi:MAG: phosphodiesterase [Gammaproteobacteria bacterium HGW-Gammaproteobacteria-1]|jgi:hypothetical protein|nr:MAG: phosphodiesterase [Gammaproteobacteria bacterium HGW-Gammaproteobacteria-1]
MNRPDYARSIVNLVAAVSGGLGGGDTGYAPLAELPPERLRDRPVALLLIDGMGDALLRQFPDSHLARARCGGLSSVFPSTTASAVTSLSTGVAPQQHAITGWHMWLRELGSVAAILPFAPRHGGAGYDRAGWTPAQLIGAPPLYDRLAVPATVLSPSWIADSPYSRASAGRAQRTGHDGLEDFFAKLVKLLRDGRPRYLYAYWAELDHLAHEYGSASPQVRAHFLALDRAYAAACTALRGSGALLVTSADHGFIDTAPAHTLMLADHPDLDAMLALPLCGESRAAYCYLRPGREADFLGYVSGELGQACVAVAGAQLIAEGWFGRGAPHPRLAQRVGDYVLLMQENYVLRDRLANEKPFRQIGVHGGVSAAEMEVPLLCVDL